MKKLLSMVLGIFLLLATFLPAGAFAAESQTSQWSQIFNKEFQSHTITKPINSILEEKVTGILNNNSVLGIKAKDLSPKDAGDTITETEPNDNPNIGEYDNFPLGDFLVGNMLNSDIDFHKIDVKNDGESIFLIGASDDSSHTLGYLLVDSNLNIVTTDSDIYYDPDSGLYYEVMPNLPRGTYYAVAGDATETPDSNTYEYALYATTLATTPFVNPVYMGDSVVTGTTDAGDTVFVLWGGNQPVSGQVDDNGNFHITITPQKTGSTLNVYAYDPFSDSYSDTTTVTVQAPVDTTAPNPPKVNPVDDNDKTITGNAEVGSKITIKNGSTAIGTAVADSKTGNFQLTINPLKAGTVLSITATDQAGNVSQPTTVTVADKTAPAAPKVNPIDDNDTSISGKAEAGSTVTIKNGSVIVGKPVADSSGNFKLGIKPIKAGTKLSFTAIDKASNTSASTTVTVADKTAPAAPKVNPIDDNDTSISGKAEAGSKVTIKNGNALVGTPIADSSGNFKLGIKPIKAGTKLSFTTTDKAGNTSGSITVTVADKTAPAVPKVHAIDDNDKTVFGKAEAYSKVTIKIGSKVFSVVSVDKNGNFKLGVKPFKAGTKLAFTATDKAGNVSKSVTLTVADKTPPSLKVYKVYHTSHYVKGKTEAHALITIKYGKKTLASKKADSKGNFTLYISKPKKGSYLTVYTSDASHNTRSMKVKVY